MENVILSSGPAGFKDASSRKTLSRMWRSALIFTAVYDDDDGIRVAEGELRHRDSDRERVSREEGARG